MKRYVIDWAGVRQALAIPAIFVGAGLGWLFIVNGGDVEATGIEPRSEVGEDYQVQWTSGPSCNLNRLEGEPGLVQVDCDCDKLWLIATGTLDRVALDIYDRACGPIRYWMAGQEKPKLEASN
jgi:hypothetical protein